MDMLTHLSINLFPIVMLLVIYINNQKKMAKTPDKREFDLLTLLTLGLMIVDILSYGAGDTPREGNGSIVTIFYMLHTILVAAVPCAWLIYVCCRLHIEGWDRRMSGTTWVARGVLAIFSLVVVTTPWTHLVFSVKETGGYQQERYYFVPYVISAGMLLVSMLFAGYSSQHEVSRERRRESIYLACLGMVPFVGIGIQYLYADWWLGGASVALSILFIYINTQNRQITTDGLTGLNNRREFDQQLRKRAEQSYGSEWGMLLLDVDDFKSINDNLGHTVGDEALWQTADILRRTLGKSKAFLARYGGDEFVVLDNFEDKAGAERLKEQIQAEVQRFNKEEKRPYQLSLSIGYALWNETQTMESLVEKADERMYEEKIRKKSRRMLR